MSEAMEKEVERLFAERPDAPHVPEVEEKHFWDWCDTNALLNIKALTWIKEEGNGYPVAFNPNPGYEITPEEDAAAEAEWHKALDRMILAFKTALVRNDTENPEAFQYLITEGFREYAKYYTHLWD